MPGVSTHSDSAHPPRFPQFRPLEIHDRDVIQGYLTAYRPQTSEWTFTNLFMWRGYYRYQWSTYRDWLLVVSLIPGVAPYALPPVGPAPRLPAVQALLQWLEEGHGALSRIERADQRLVEELGSGTDLAVEAAGQERIELVVLPGRDVDRLGGIGAEQAAAGRPLGAREGEQDRRRDHAGAGEGANFGEIGHDVPLGAGWRRRCACVELAKPDQCGIYYTAFLFCDTSEGTDSQKTY